jgi:hypothetical protein
MLPLIAKHKSFSLIPELPGEAKPAATTANNKHDDDDDENCLFIHGRLPGKWMRCNFG